MCRQNVSILNCWKDLKTMKNKHITTADALAQLAEQVDYLRKEIKAAQQDGDKKLYCSLMRLYLPALKEYTRLSAMQESGEQEDALLAFTGGGN